MIQMRSDAVFAPRDLRRIRPPAQDRADTHGVARRASGFRSEHNAIPHTKTRVSSETLVDRDRALGVRPRRDRVDALPRRRCDGNRTG
jgi:hypothetical protein